MRYSTVTEEQLVTLQQGLDLLAHVSQDLVPTTLYFYGVLKADSPALTSADEAVWEDSYAGETRAEELHIQTVSIAIRLSSDVLRLLLGSGLRAEQEEFSYMLNGEIHESSFSYTQSKPMLSIGQFEKIALADDSYYLKDFIQAEGQAHEQQNPGVVTRTDEAVAKGDHGGSEALMHKDHPHQSSLKQPHVKIWADLHIANWEDEDTHNLITRISEAKTASSDQFVVWAGTDRLMVVQASEPQHAVDLIARSTKTSSAQIAREAQVLSRSQIIPSLKGYLVD